MRRIVLAVAGVVLLVGAALFYIVKARHAVTMAEPAEPVTLTPGQLLFRNTETGQVAAVSLTDPGGARRASGVKCDRFGAARQTPVCLIAQPGVLPPVTDVVVLDANLAERHRETLPGVPSRARVSPDGKFVAWTLFVTGDSYAATGFSTRAGLYEVETGRLV